MLDLNTLPNMTGRKLFHDRVVVEEQIGIGGWGSVYKAKDVCDGKALAVKCVPFKEMEDFQRVYLMQECRVHATLSGHHEGILRQQSYEFDHEEGIAYIALEYCESGELFDIINANKYFGNLDLIKDHFLQLLDVVEFMHSKGCYHRDIKPENILIKGNGKLVLADFGFVIDKRNSPARTSRLGTVGYMAHELLNIIGWSHHEVDHAKTDIWALGMTLFAMITGDIPWETASEEEDDSYWRFRQNPQTYLNTHFDISPAANFLFVRIFNKTASHRPDIAAIRSCVEKIETFGSGRRKSDDGTLEPYPEPYFRPGFKLEDDIIDISVSEPQFFRSISRDLDDKDRMTPTTLKTSILADDEDKDCDVPPIPYAVPVPRKSPAIPILRRKQDSNAEIGVDIDMLALELSETSSAESYGPETPQTLAEDAAQADKAASIPKLVLDIPAAKFAPRFGAKQALKNFKAKIHMSIRHSIISDAT